MSLPFNILSELEALSPLVDPAKLGVEYFVHDKAISPIGEFESIDYFPAHEHYRDHATTDEMEMEFESPENGAVMEYDQPIHLYEPFTETQAEYNKQKKTIQNNIISITQAELSAWQGKIETDTGMYEYVKKYWMQGVDMSKARATGIIEERKRWLAGDGSVDQNEWSAAFISYVMRKASNNIFYPSSAHNRYAEWAYNNGKTNSKVPFRIFKIEDVKLEVGDILLNARPLHAGKTIATFDNIITGAGAHGAGAQAHGDIVIAVDNVNNKVKLVGGNKEKNVETVIHDTVNGQIVQTTFLSNKRRYSRFIGIIKLMPDIADGLTMTAATGVGTTSNYIYENRYDNESRYEQDTFPGHGATGYEAVVNENETFDNAQNIPLAKEYKNEINELLVNATGKTGQLLDSADFTNAMMAWKRQNGLSADIGSVDEEAWKHMRPLLKGIIKNSIVESWGDDQTVGHVIDRITYLNYPDGRKFNQMTKQEQGVFTTLWKAVDLELLDARRDLFSKGFIPGKGGPAVPHGLHKIYLNGNPGLNKYSSEKVSDAAIRLNKNGALSNLGISASDIDICQRIANNESLGSFQDLYTPDNMIISIGFRQWTFVYGDIHNWIGIAPAAFKRYGIEIDQSLKWYPKITDDAAPLPQLINLDKPQALRWNGWAESFYYAGLDDEIMLAGFRLAKQYFINELKTFENHLGSSKNATYRATFIDFYNSSPHLQGLFHELTNAGHVNRITSDVLFERKYTDVNDFIKEYSDAIINDKKLNAHIPKKGEDIVANVSKGIADIAAFSNNYLRGNTFTVQAFQPFELETHKYPAIYRAKYVHPHKAKQTNEYECGKTGYSGNDESCTDGGWEIHNADGRSGEMEQESNYLVNEDEYEWEVWNNEQEPTRENWMQFPSVPLVAPPLIKEDVSLPGYTCYVNINIGKANYPMDMTGIYVPPGFDPRKPADIILYFHGITSVAPGEMAKIDRYWVANDGKSYDLRLREEVSDSGQNVILVAPSMGAHPNNQHNSISASDDGLDGYLTQVLIAVNTHIIQKRFQAPPIDCRNVILAAHSAGGAQMRIAVTRTNPVYYPKISECWGFDCIYDGEYIWAKWARTNPGKRLFIYFLGSTSDKSTWLSANTRQLYNVFVKRSTAKGHYFVPKEHLKDRILKIGQAGLTKINFEQYDGFGNEYAATELENESTIYNTGGGHIPRFSSEVNTGEAIRLNRYYSVKLGWQKYNDRINDLLLPLSGKTNASLDEGALADAIAAWQLQQKIPAKTADGVIGPKTWAMMKLYVTGIDDATAQKEWSANTNIKAYYANAQEYKKIRNQVGDWDINNQDPAAYIETSLGEWNANRQIHEHFNGKFDGDPESSYLNLKRLYQKRGIADPAGYFATNIVQMQFFNKSTPLHKDLRTALTTAQNAFSASGQNFNFNDAWSFVPRTISGKPNDLSNHALGKALDINAGANPHITSADEIFIIDTICQTVLPNGLLAESNPDVFRNASDLFKQTFNDAWIKQQTSADIKLALKGRHVLGHLQGYAANGFMSLSTPLIDGLKNAGLNWGGNWSTHKDFMHFELPNP